MGAAYRADMRLLWTSGAWLPRAGGARTTATSLEDAVATPSGMNEGCEMTRRPKHYLEHRCRPVTSAHSHEGVLHQNVRSGGTSAQLPRGR